LPSGMAGSGFGRDLAGREWRAGFRAPDTIAVKTAPTFRRQAIRETER
jgi:hypothetical protein